MKPVPGFARPAQMVFRLAFVVALVLGLDQWWSSHPASGLLTAHIITGIILLITLWMLAVAYAQGVLWGAAVLATLGGALGLMARGMGGAWGILHLVVMIAVIGMAEAGCSRARRTRSSA